MRLLVLATHLDKPEAAIFAGLKARGVDVHVAATPHPEHRATLEAAGVPIIDLTIGNRFDVKGMRAIRALMREHSFDVIYALSNRALSTTVISLFSRDTPIVAYRGTVGHISWFDPSSWFTYLNPRVSKILCVSRAVEEYLRSVGISQSRLTTIYKGHDIRWYTPKALPERAAFNIPSDAFVVGCTAMMRAVKGIDDLLQAVSLLLTDLPRLHLLLVGAIKDRDIENHIARFPDQSRIHLTGFRGDATDLARLADVTVMASKSREGFPKSVIEAMSQGVPAIVTSVGGMPELVNHGAAGLLVPPKDPHALADAIRSLYHDEARRQELGRAARERIQTAFNISDTITRVHETLTDVVSRNRTRALLA